MELLSGGDRFVHNSKIDYHPGGSYRTLSIDTDITTCSYHNAACVIQRRAAWHQSALPGFIELTNATSIDKRHWAALAARSNFSA
jgi:hypothetical protein